MKSKYVYPAIFEKESCGYSVVFPDLNIATSGSDLPEAIDMARDAMCLILYDMEENRQTIPEASAVTEVTTNGTQFVSLVECDTVEYRKFFNNTAVKKTLSIPAWLNTMAEREGINFSAVLQSALKETLGIA